MCSDFHKVVTFFISCLQNGDPSLGRNCWHKICFFPCQPFLKHIMPEVKCSISSSLWYYHKEKGQTLLFGALGIYCGGFFVCFWDFFCFVRVFFLCVCVWFFLSPFFLFFSSHISFFKRVVRIASEDRHQVAEPLLQSPGCWCCSQQFCLSTFLVY